MTLREACGEYFIAGQQGQLVIKFASDVHLCKILVENGKAVHISHGRNDPESILDSLSRKSVEWVNFIAGYPVRKQLDFPLHEKLLSAISNQPGPKAVAAPSAPPAGAPSAPSAASPQPASPSSAEPQIPAQRVAETIDSLTELIGPMGRFLADQIAKSFNYTSGNPMAKSIYGKFISALAKEIPDDMQASFLNKFRA